jgi:uncharacterized protein YndB with AHSA1/START domain
MVIRAELATDRDATWAALTEPSLVERWFTRASRVGTAGDAYVLDFGDGDVMRGELLEVVPRERLAYSWGWGDDAAARTRVRWELADGEDGTRVTLTHDGWAEAGLTPKDRDEHAAYWEGYVAALVETTDEAVAGADAGEDAAEDARPR